MPSYRVCKSFIVESGHMLSKHPESCRYPHGHSRRIDLVVSSETLDENDMVVDFKALKHAVSGFVEHLDHRMAINRRDPLLPSLQAIHPDSLVVFDQDPTTEVLAKHIYDFVSQVLERGYDSGPYRIAPRAIRLDRVRVGETDTSWAEYGE